MGRADELQSQIDFLNEQMANTWEALAAMKEMLDQIQIALQTLAERDQQLGSNMDFP